MKNLRNDEFQDDLKRRKLKDSKARRHSVKQDLRNAILDDLEDMETEYFEKFRCRN